MKRCLVSRKPIPLCLLRMKPYPRYHLPLSQGVSLFFSFQFNPFSSHHQGCPSVKEKTTVKSFKYKRLYCFDKFQGAYIFRNSLGTVLLALTFSVRDHSRNLCPNAVQYTLSPLDGPYAPMINTVKDIFSGGKVQKYSRYSDGSFI